MIQLELFGVLKNISWISWMMDDLNKLIGAHESFWYMYFFNMGENIVRHNTVLSHSRALIVWARSPLLGCITYPQTDQLMRKENMRAIMQGKGKQEGWRCSASEHSKWDYFGGSDSAQLKKGSLKVSIKMKGKIKLRRNKTLMVNLWTWCVISLTD